MTGLLTSKKDRFTTFFSDSVKGFMLVWNISRRISVLNMVLFVLQSVLPVLSLIVLKQLIDVVVAEGVINWQNIGGCLIWYGLIQVGAVIATQGAQYYQSIQQQLISDKISQMVLEKAIVIDLKHYENPSFYDDLHMAQQQSQYKPAQVVMSFQGIIQSALSFSLVAAYLATVHWAIIPLVILLAIPMAITRLINGYQQYRLEKECMPSQRKASDLFNYLTKDDYAKEVRIFNYGKSFIAQFAQLRKYIYGKKNALSAKFARYNVLVLLMEVGATLLMYILLINSAVSGMITIGGLVIYIQLLARMQSSVSALFQSFIGLFQNQLYLRQILVYLSVDNSRVSKNKPFNAVTKEVRVQNLKFIYPDTKTAVLQNVSMVLKPGQIIAIVGENGSGKSTFIKILCKLYDVEHGQIEYDGQDIADIDGEHLRTYISVVFQDYGKYYSTVEDNIAIGEIEKDSVRLDSAAKMAGVIAKINRLSKGYKTILGRTYRNGEQLSGGEWQKIALARGLYKNSQILILDEPTSAMDPHAEHAVFESIKQDMGNKIVILITHRLYNLKLADNIYVFENGTIAESGTFDGLIKAKGQFYDMYRKQVV